MSPLFVGCRASDEAYCDDLAFGDIFGLLIELYEVINLISTIYTSDEVLTGPSGDGAFSDTIPGPASDGIAETGFCEASSLAV